MKRCDKLIALAIKALKDTQIVERNQVSKQFNGYISSFGANVIQSGLLATVIFYSNQQSSAEKERIKIPKAIKNVLCNKYKEYEGKGEELYQIIINCQENLEQEHLLQKRILNIATSLKLSLRTFKLV